MARRQGPRPEKRSNVTVGDYLAIVAAKALVYPRTLESYAVALRKIAADVVGVRQKPRARRGANKPTRSASQSSPRKRSKSGGRTLSAAARSTRLPNAVQISAQSFIARARSLFGKKVLPHVKGLVDLPDPAPFYGVKIGKTRPQRYRSTFDVAALIQAARRELPAEQLKIFILAAMAGLRRNEIDKLPWTAFRWEEGILRIEATEYFRPKARNRKPMSWSIRNFLRSSAAIMRRRRARSLSNHWLRRTRRLRLKSIAVMRSSTR